MTSPGRRPTPSGSGGTPGIRDVAGTTSPPNVRGVFRSRSGTQSPPLVRRDAGIASPQQRLKGGSISSNNRCGTTTFAMMVILIFTSGFSMILIWKGSSSNPSLLEMDLNLVSDNRDGSRDNNMTTHETSSSLYSTPVNQSMEAITSQLDILPPQWTTSYKYYILEQPELTFEYSNDTTLSPSMFYERSLNEYEAEAWLHRGFSRHPSVTPSRTMDPNEAHVFLIPAYLHFLKRSLISHGARRKQQTQDEVPTEKIIGRSIVAPEKPHILLTPSVNPVESRKIGIKRLVNQLRMQYKVNLFSVAFERNKFWQQMEPERMIVIPYVVRMPETQQERPNNGSDDDKIIVDDPSATPTATSNNTRRPNFVFYSGNARKNSLAWGGCDRTMVTPLSNRTDMHVHLVGNRLRLAQNEYNRFMEESDYCLILCGDTVTSRSMASSMVANCIPIRVGSRLRGYCETPCRKGWGWTITSGLAHLPYGDSIPWLEFPEVDEADFIDNPFETLQEQVFDRYDENRKNHLRSMMQQVRSGFVYGYGNPIESLHFGNAVPFIWKSIVLHLSAVGALK